MPQKSFNVVVNENKVRIYKMENQLCVNDFIRNLQLA